MEKDVFKNHKAKKDWHEVKRTTLYLLEEGSPGNRVRSVVLGDWGTSQMMFSIISQIKEAGHRLRMGGGRAGGRKCVRD